MDMPKLPQESELREWFRSNHDVTFQSLRLGTYPRQGSLLMIYCEGVCEDRQINEVVLPSLHRVYRTQMPKTAKELEITKPLAMKRMKVKNQQEIQDEVSRSVFNGHLVLYFLDLNVMYSVRIANPPKREPDEPSTEISVRGARDGFVEELETNIGLIRKRLPTRTMAYEQFLIGRRTRTKVALLYLDDIANPAVIEDVRKRLENADLDALHSSSQLEDVLNLSRMFIFPMFSYTGRPDFVTACLVNGRFALLADGAAQAIIAPVSLFFLMQGPSDVNTSFFFTSFQRWIRLIGLTIALLLPAFWTALNAYHQDQLPYVMLATIVISRQGVPMSAPIEAFLMILLFELFREAGLRLPSSVGQTLSVVGGLIIGQAAISAGLTSPSMLVVIALSAVASFILGNQDLSGTVRILNLFFVFISSLFGMFGFFICLYAMLIYLANLRSFGVPYLAPVAPIVLPDLLFNFFPFPLGKAKKRSEVVSPTDSDRKGEGSS